MKQEIPYNPLYTPGVKGRGQEGGVFSEAEGKCW